MNLTAEQMDQGRRNFLRILAGVPAVATPRYCGRTSRSLCRVGPSESPSSASVRVDEPCLTDVDPAYAQVRALCDINPSSLAQGRRRAEEELGTAGKALLRLEGDAAEGGH